MKSFLSLLLFAISFTFCYSQENISYKEDFKKAGTGWIEEKGATYEAKVSDGVYWMSNHIADKQKNFFKDVYVNINEDFYLETSLKQTGGNANNGYGIFFGTASDVIFFVVSSNGYYKIYKRENRELIEIKKWTNLKEINEKGKDNKLVAEVVDDQIKFKVNDKEVAKTRYSGFHIDYIGFNLENQIEIEVDYVLIKNKGAEINLIDDPINGAKKENLGASVNSEYNEISPVITQDGKTLYFCRDLFLQNSKGKSNQDIYFSVFESDKWTKAESIGFPLNNSGPNSVLSVSPDGNTLLLNNLYDENGETTKMGLSMSQKSAEGWSLPVEVVIENYYNKSRFVNFFLSPDQNILLMACKRDDSYGEQDIYVSIKRGNKFSEPINLGEKINSRQDDFSPFLAADNKTLYFSSSGKPGYGNADIYVSKRLDTSWMRWSEPKNLGPEINTPFWDAYYTIPASGDYAYLVSKENTLGESDIFRIKLPEGAKPEPVVLVFGKVKNEITNDFIEAKIEYRDLITNKLMGTASSNPTDGTYKIILPYGQKYSFLATKEGFYPVSQNIDLSEISQYQEIEKDLLLSPLKLNANIRLNNVFFDSDKSILKEESYPELERLVKLLNDQPTLKIEIAGHTDSDGNDDYNLKLSQDRTNSVVNYLIKQGIDKTRLVSKGYGETKPIQSNTTEEGKAQNRRVEFMIIEM